MEDEKRDIVMEDSIDKKDTDKENKDNRSIGEKIEDTMDDVVAGVQDFFYGEKTNSLEDIPATIQDPDNEMRHINKIQTRRNFNKKILPKIGKFLLIFIPIVVVVGLIGRLIFTLLMA